MGGGSSKDCFYVQGFRVFCFCVCFLCQGFFRVAVHVSFNTLCWTMLSFDERVNRRQFTLQSLAVPRVAA